MSFVVLGIVLVTLGLMLVRPGDRPEGLYATAGAIAVVATGAVAIGDIPSLVGDVSNVLLFLAGMLLLVGVVDQARVFTIVAELCAQWARGSGPLLYMLIALLAIAVTTLLSLDVTVILLTPIVLSLAGRRGLDPIPMLFATVFLANIASLALPVSNLTNLLLFDRLDLRFSDFAGVMWWPNLVASVTALVLLWWLFRRRIPPRFGQPAPDIPVVHVVTPWTGFCAAGLTVTLVALVALGFAGYPLWWAAVTGGVLLGGLAVGSRRMSVPQIAEALSPSVFLFVISMTVVIAAFERAWLDERTITLPESEVGGMILAMLGNAAGSNVVNNVPMVLLSAGIIERASPHLRDALTYGSLVGANIGPALTTYGSLATILWLTFLRRHGVEVRTADYLRVSLLVVPVVLVVTTAALAMSLR